MGAKEKFFSFAIFSIFFILCIFPEPGKTQVFSGDSSSGNPSAAEKTEMAPLELEEEIAPLPPVLENEDLSEGKSAERKNGKNNQIGKVENIEDFSTQLAPYCPPDPCRPGPLKLFIHHFVADWRENNRWPNGLPEPDRQQVWSTLATQIHHGWRRQNLLSDFHFEPETGQLTSAGQEKLRWILWEVPEKHRIVYVARSVNPAETAARVASVQKAASQLVGDRPLPPILETELSPIGWPASEVDAIQRRFQETAPPPRLTPQNSSSETTQ